MFVNRLNCHRLGRLHVLRQAFDTGAKIWFASSARIMKDARRLFKACNDIEPEVHYNTHKIVLIN